MTCPNCSAGEISPLTHRCEMCGFVPEGTVAVETPLAETVDEVARQELATAFRFGAVLGHGATTVVYQAREPQSTRDIAVKVIPRPSEARAQADERFARAVEAVAALDHPHIVPVFAHGTTPHLYWYTMELVRGRSLRDFLGLRGPMELKACQRLVAQVASALDHAHRRGIVHGALKPENVLIDAEGWVHVCDLLVATALRPPVPLLPPAPPRPSAARPPADAAPRGGPPLPAPLGAPLPAPPRKIVRTPYDAPDELRTQFADQYALAAIVYECLAGAAPPEARAVGRAAPTTRVTFRPEVPASLAYAVRKALSSKPIDRFPGVLDFVNALESAVPATPEVKVPARGSSGMVLVQTDWEPPPRPVDWRVIAGAAALLVTVVLLAFPLRPAAGRWLQRLFGGGSPAAVVAPVTDSIAQAAPARDTVSSLAAAARPDAPAPRPPSPSVRRQRTRAGTQPAPVTRAARPAQAAREPGRLFVNADPWGQLYVDGQLVGNTPRAAVPLAAGAHTVRVVREGYEPFERTIQVASGQVVRMTDIVLIQRRP